MSANPEGLTMQIYVLFLKKTRGKYVHSFIYPYGVIENAVPYLFFQGFYSVFPCLAKFRFRIWLIFRKSGDLRSRATPALV